MKIELGKSINAVRFMHIHHYFRRTYGGSLSEVRWDIIRQRYARSLLLSVRLRARASAINFSKTSSVL